MTAPALLGVVLASMIAASTLMASPASAHPMGNFSISHYSSLTVGATEIELRYVVDLAEIPTFQELQDNDIAPASDPRALDAYLARRVESLGAGLHLEVDGQHAGLAMQSKEMLFTPGAGDLPTMKVGVVYRARLDAVKPAAWRSVRSPDDNFRDRAGWKEVVAAPAADVVLAGSSVPARDRSRQLTDYPTDMLNSPPQVLEARLAFTREAPAAAILTPRAPSAGPRTPKTSDAPAGSSATLRDDSPALVTPAASASAGAPHAPGTDLALRPNTQAARRDAFGDLMGLRPSGVGVFFFAALVAATLGAFHALEPGHGKTV